MKLHALLYFLAFSLLSSSAVAARYVPIKIFLDDELILEGNASDDGRRDADEVWDALKHVNLGETDAFIRLFGENTGDELNIWKKREGELPLKIKIDVAYGGLAEVTGLRITRQPPDGAGRTWRIHSEDISDSFNRRMIRRSDAARLSNPKRTK